jgi:hypothetical protein
VHLEVPKDTVLTKSVMAKNMPQHLAVEYPNSFIFFYVFQKRELNSQSQV